MITALHQVAQRATDLDRSIAFYRDTLGLRLIARFDPPGIAFLEANGVRILLEANAQPATIYFRVDDIAAAHQRLIDAGVTIEQPPTVIHKDDAGDFGSPGNEESMCFFRDPDGNLLAVAAQAMPSG